MGADTFLLWHKQGSTKLPLPERQITANVKPQKSPRKNSRFNDFLKVINNNIFKTSSAKEKDKEEKKPPKEVEITKLELKLKGTVLGNGDRAYAVIQDLRDRKEDLYYLNDVVQGAQIVDILADRVVLQVEGRKEILPLSMKSEGSYRRSSISRRTRIKRPPVRRRTYPRRSKSRKER